MTFTDVVQAAIPKGQFVGEGKGTHWPISIWGAAEAVSRSATFEVREI